MLGVRLEGKSGGGGGIELLRVNSLEEKPKQLSESMLYFRRLFFAQVISTSILAS